MPEYSLDGIMKQKVDLTGTMFQFPGGAKVTEIENGVSEIKVEVDNQKLLNEKYVFASEYAPQVWLSELDDGWWPGDLQSFFDNS